MGENQAGTLKRMVLNREIEDRVERRQYMFEQVLINVSSLNIHIPIQKVY